MIPGICWQEFPTSNQLAVNALNNAGFKALRIFFNMRDLPRKSDSTAWQGYIQYLFNTMPNGLHTFMFEGHPSVNITGEPMRASFDFCKRYNWLPIVCMGTSEESVSGEWIGRVPTDWAWIGRFIKEFAIYLKTIYGFNRADLEIWNEPSKIFNYNNYCDLALIMVNGWRVPGIGKTHIFADDLLRQSYLDAILTRADLCNKVDYISTHIGVGSEDDEWDRTLVKLTAQKISIYPNLKQALTEMSVNGIWSRLNQLPNNVAMYGIIGAIRNKEFGTATRIDDLWFWTRTGGFEITSQEKVNIITNFNKTYYKPYILENEDMELNYVKSGTINEETRTVQEILKDSGYVVTVTGKCDINTVVAIKDFQTDYGLKVDGWVGKLTWDKLLYETSTGTTRFCQFLTRTAVYR